MKRLELIQALQDADIDADSISFYSIYNSETNECEESPDSHFGTCDLSGERGSIADCVARSISTNEIIEFQAGEWLIGGGLGRLAGAF